jgi:hypothetical protein
VIGQPSLFWASILLASAALLFSDVPAALYARLVERNAGKHGIDVGLARRRRRLDPARGVEGL